MNAKPALLVEKLNKNYQNGTSALIDINLRIEPGEFFAILGPNGAGKSTLINILSQVVNKTSGKVEISGICIDQKPQTSKMHIGVTPQEIALDPFFKVRDVLCNHSGYYGCKKNDPWIDTLMAKLALTPHANQFSRQLSGGMKRRLTIAKALVHQPKLLVLDEPTAGVDVKLRHGLWDFVKELHQQGTTIILTTHYLEEAQALANRVAIMDKGKIIVCEPTHLLLKRFGGRYFEVTITPGNPLSPCCSEMHYNSKKSTMSGELNDQNAPVLYQWLGENANRIFDLKMTTPNLEDVFLKLTGET